MRAWGIVLILSGFFLMCVCLAFSVRVATEEREHKEEYANWWDQKYDEHGAPVPSGPYPREARWNDEEILFSSLAYFGPWLFFAGCVLYGAGEIRAGQKQMHLKLASVSRPGDHIEQHVGRIGEILAFIAKQTPRKSEETQRKEAAEAAAEAAAAKKAAEEAAEAAAKKAEEEAAAAAAKKAAEEAAHPAQSPLVAIVKKKLSAWWPASPTGIALLCVWLAITFFAPMARSGASPVDGVMGAGINYFIVIFIRYLTVVLPSRKQ